MVRTETVALAGFAILLVALALVSSEFARVEPGDSFRRGISLGFIADALVALLVATALNPAFPDLVPLAVMLALTLLAGRRIYRRHPSPIL